MVSSTIPQNQKQHPSTPTIWVDLVLIVCSLLVGSSASLIGLIFLDQQAVSMPWSYSLLFAVTWSTTTALAAHLVLESVYYCCFRYVRWTNESDIPVSSCKGEDTERDDGYHILRSEDTNDKVDWHANETNKGSPSANSVALFVGGTFLSFTVTCGFHDRAMWHTLPLPPDTTHVALLAVATVTVTLTLLVVTCSQAKCEEHSPSPFKHSESVVSSLRDPVLV